MTIIQSAKILYLYKRLSLRGFSRRNLHVSKIFINNKINKSAFTLAEVLITLLIIGTVASLTIPTLINDTRDAELKEKFKKTYATIDNAYRLAIADNGGYLDNVPLYHMPLLNKFIPFLHITKKCNDWDSYVDGYYPGCPACDPPVPATQPGANNGICYISTKFKRLNGTVFSIGWPDDAGVVLTDGSTLLFRRASVTCTGERSNATGATYNQSIICGSFLVDVNGFSPPNTAGKDIFGLWVLKDKIVPYGVNDSTIGTCNSSSSGLGCAAEYLKQ